MVIKLYRHINTLSFDDPEKLIIFNNQVTYKQDYASYIAPANFWTGNGKTFNIENLTACDIYINEYKNAAGYYPVYLSSVNPDGTIFYYYVSDIEYLPDKVRLYLILDTFATWYGRAQLERYPIVTKSTLKLKNRLIPLIEEITPDNIITETPVAGNTGTVAFLIKIKALTAKKISTEAYTLRYAVIRANSPEGGYPSFNDAQKIYDKICNIYEVQTSIEAIGLATQVEEVYFLPVAWLKTEGADEEERYFHYIDPTTGEKSSLRFYLLEGTNPYKYPIQHTNGGYNKLIIGNNQIELPAYYFEEYPTADRITITPIFNVSSFDILLSYQLNEPISIKKYFQCEVVNSTQETSLQKIARIAQYIITGSNAITSAGTQTATAAATGNPLGFVAAANTLKGAADSITANLISTATKEALPSTSYETSAFNVFYDEEGAKRVAIISQAYLSNITQAVENLRLYGVDWFNPILRLEELVNTEAYKTIVEQNSRIYIEANTKWLNVPYDVAQDMQQLLKGGVVLVKG